MTRAPEKFVIEAWPDARVQTFEDGLFSYLPRRAAPAEPAGWCRDLRDWLDAKRPVRRFRRHKAWLAYARHPHGGVRVRQFQEAIDAGVVTAAEVDDAVERGWTRPSPPVQLRAKPSLWPMFSRRAAPRRCSIVASSRAVPFDNGSVASARAERADQALR